MTIRRSLQVFLALVVAVVALGLAQPAGAVDNPDYTAPPPSTVVQSTTPAPVQQVQTAAAVPDRLAITGSDSAQLAVIGAVLVAGGAVVLVARRRVTA
ncbi:MAG: LPXTG cell wall anchor domain-containing protein [Actinobacteria bacterium]|nr:LPXTG cell wall anchor domain-containing protein [Actinomycetota bacterium]